jgi:hypothetical protein
MLHFLDYMQNKKIIQLFSNSYKFYKKEIFKKNIYYMGEKTELRWKNGFKKWV